MRGVWVLAAVWLAGGVVEVPAVGKNPFRGDPPRCPFPGSGTVHLYGKIESVTVVRNPVKHESKALLALPRKPEVWEEKHLLHMRIDSTRGSGDMVAPMVSYPKDYLRAVHGLPSRDDHEFGRLSEGPGLFRFQSRGGELVLERFWPGWYVAEYPKVCWESPPGLDSLEVE